MEAIRLALQGKGIGGWAARGNPAGSKWKSGASAPGVLVWEAFRMDGWSSCPVRRRRIGFGSP